MPDVRIPAQAVYIASLAEPKRSPWRRLVDRLPWRRNRDPFAGWQDLGFLDDAEVTFAYDGSRDDDDLLVVAIRRTSDSLELVERVTMRAELRAFEREVRRIYEHALYELEAASVYESEVEALAKARFALRFLGAEAAVAILRGWMRNPRRTP